MTAAAVGLASPLPDGDVVGAVGVGVEEGVGCGAVGLVVGVPVAVGRWWVGREVGVGEADHGIALGVGPAESTGMVATSRAIASSTRVASVGRSSPDLRASTTWLRS
ncbi:MAG TPA: hypothetical protein VFE07_07980 [Marmoricola sp.]|nr:hypothetical protein [Marmoricola sp.]